MERGFYGIGIENVKTETNIGTLFRSAMIFDAAFVFTIGKRYRRQTSDTLKTWRHIPLFHFESFDDFYAKLPYDALLVGVELDNQAQPLKAFTHPQRAVYLLGAEDHGLTSAAKSKCHKMIVLPGKFCMNVAVAGSIVMHDRFTRE